MDNTETQIAQSLRTGSKAESEKRTGRTTGHPAGEPQNTGTGDGCSTTRSGPVRCESKICVVNEPPPPSSKDSVSDDDSVSASASASTTDDDDDNTDAEPARPAIWEFQPA